MSKIDPPFHSVRINFNGVKRYRDFPFLPHIGDRINLTDKDVSESYSLIVESVWFDDDYGENEVEVNLNCRMLED